MANCDQFKVTVPAVQQGRKDGQIKPMTDWNVDNNKNPIGSAASMKDKDTGRGNK